MTSPLSIAVRDGIATVTLSRPQKHNAIDSAMLDALASAPKNLARDRSLRAVILRGDGPSFCSGLDFPSFTSQPTRIARAFAKLGRGPTNRFQRAAWAWRQLPVPVIAALHGRCYGGGLQLALAADFRISTPDCELAILEAKWGLVPDMSGTAALRELIGMDWAKLLTMTGRIIDGEQALSIGLVTALDGDPLTHARALAAEIATRSPDSVAATKRLFHRNWVASEREAFAQERRVQLAVMAGANFREALSANFKRVPPRFGPRSWWI